MVVFNVGIWMYDVGVGWLMMMLVLSFVMVFFV